MLNSLINESNKTYTANGAGSYASTLNAVVDFFGNGGAMRNRQAHEQIQLFSRAFAQDPLVTLKLLFYFRDIKQGQGERNMFRNILKHLACNHSDVMRKNIQNIATFGRWDDVLVLLDTPVQNSALNIIKEQFAKDLADMNSNKPISLLAKWLPSGNSNATRNKYNNADKALKVKERVQVLNKLRGALNLTEYEGEYRKKLSALRRHLNVVERLMSKKEFDKISFEQVPSVAHKLYRKAFIRQDEFRYLAYLEAVEQGKTEINAGALYPYDIVSHYMRKYSYDKTLELQWKALPNFIGDKEENSLVMADVSGSMSGRPMEVSISLAIYIAERNKGLFHNYFMTFSEKPTLQKVQGSTLQEKVINLQNASWGMNTNLKSAFDLILKSAIKGNVPKEEMVKKLYIISDMQFDSACGKNPNNHSLFDSLKEEYKQHGYELPTVVFWNVNATPGTFPVTVADSGVQLVSGCSPSILKMAMTSEIKSAYDLVLDVVNQERYDCITI